MESISASTQKNAAGTEEVLATMDEFSQHVGGLHDIANNLKHNTDFFEVEE